MDLLEELMGSGKKREDVQDYVNRYEKGPAWDGYSDEEVLDRYGSVAHKVPQTEYEQAARSAFDRLSPEEQAEFANYLEEKARRKNIPIPQRESSGGGLADWLSKATGQVHQQPGALRDMLAPAGSGASPGAGMGGLLSSPLAKAALAGIGAMLFKKLLTRR
jgi:hypothetical protein